MIYITKNDNEAESFLDAKRVDVCASKNISNIVRTDCTMSALFRSFYLAWNAFWWNILCTRVLCERSWNDFKNQNLDPKFIQNTSWLIWNDEI